MNEENGSLKQQIEENEKQKDEIIINLKTALEEKETELENSKQVQEEKDTLIGELKEAKETLEENMEKAQEEADERVNLLEDQKIQIKRLEADCKDFKDRITESETNFEKLTKSYEDLTNEYNVNI